MRGLEVRSESALRHPRSVVGAFALMTLFAIASASCASNVRIDGPQGNASSFGAIPLFADQDTPAEISDKATITGAVKLPPGDDQNHNVLVLSGGGSHGAFGAGILNGWSESGKRPRFEIVTGVSTGALMASFAFLGPSWDVRLHRFYTNITNDQIYTSRGVGGFFNESLYDTTPLKKLIASIVTHRMLDAVAAEHRRGRRLYIATTNLDLGKVVVWDMGGIAASGHKQRLALYRQILLSSAAVPGLFKPVYIMARDGHAHMHVDGGIKAPILLRSFMVGGKHLKRRIYVLVNGKLSLLAGAPPVGPNFKDISLRSISELMRGLYYKTIYQGYVTTRNAGGQFRIIYLPDEVPTGDPFKFDKKEMRRLFEIGRKLGRDSKNWHREPPRLESLERVASPRR
jgi:predicted acylesterase/phospholipase RssA